MCSFISSSLWALSSLRLAEPLPETGAGAAANTDIEAAPIARTITPINKTFFIFFIVKTSFVLFYAHRIT
jgi:hypothetical protein